MAEILIIEDESVIRLAIERLLKRYGYTPTGYESVEKALNAAPLTHYDLILADIRLPGRSGIDIIREAGHVPVIIMTSYASVRSAVEAMRCGAADYVAKPFDTDDFRTTIERALDKKTQSPKTWVPQNPDLTLELSLEEYFRAFVKVHEKELTETELARRLGISRKALWERRQRLGLQRQRQAG
ncbi:MAG: response regulator [Spiribacter sp.]|jgi:DNA-binding NtrC family response regulator|nr:response regulator [Spiribacter sp.]MDR9489588.1 response regulator [Spiribacter sp.]